MASHKLEVFALSDLGKGPRIGEIQNRKETDHVILRMLNDNKLIPNPGSEEMGNYEAQNIRKDDCNAA